MESDWRRKVRSVFLLGVVFLIVLFFNHWFGAGLMGNMADRDFAHLATGVKALVLGLDPYDPRTWPDLRRSFGGTVIQDPACNYPLWVLVLFAPLALFPFSLAVPLWMTASEFALVVSVGLLAVATDFRRSRWLTFSALLGSLLFRPFVVSLTSGQMLPFLLLVVAAASFAYVRGQSFWSGFLLGLVIAKPHLFILFLPAVGLLFLTRRDWRALGGLLVSIMALFITSWLIRPGWLWPWLGARAKAGLTFGTPTLWGLAFDVVGPEHWILAGALTAVLVSGLTLFLIVRRSGDPAFGIGLAVCGSLLVTPYLWNYDQLLLLVPALIAFGCMSGNPLPKIAMWFVVMFVIPWGLFCVANLRGFDPLSAFVTVVIMICLSITCRGRDRARVSAPDAYPEREVVP